MGSGGPLCLLRERLLLGFALAAFLLAPLPVAADELSRTLALAGFAVRAPGPKATESAWLGPAVAGLALVAFMAAAAVLAPLLAGSRPLLARVDGGWMAPALMSRAGLRARGLPGWDDPRVGFKIMPPVPWSPEESDFSFAWWLAVFPGAAIFLTVTGYNLIGQGLRDATDPRLIR